MSVIDEMMANSPIKLDFGIMIIVVCFVAAAFVGMFILNGKYPRRKFIVSIDGNPMFETRQFRLDNDKIVGDNVLELIFDQGLSIGEDIKDFDRIILNGKQYYVAVLTKKTLLPLKWAPNGTFTYKMKTKDENGKITEINIPIEINTLVPSEIVTGRRLGERYVEMQKKRQMIAEANRTMMMNLMIAAPIAIILLATIAASYLSNKYLNDAWATTAGALAPITNDLKEITSYLSNKNNGTLMPDVPKRYNVTGG